MAEKRSIFEEVTGGRIAPVAPVNVEALRAANRRVVARWLLVLAVLVVAIILLGGLTRLTDSGLSITEWKPVTGMVPPLGADDWAAEFALYQASPEYQLQNRGMELAEFKQIYLWEWAHRFLGRVIGLVWAGGFLWFVLRRAVPPGWTGRLLALGAGIGVQGVVGWWMVSSGLTGQMVDVAASRLAIHLAMAFGILGLLVWAALWLQRSEGEMLQARRQRQEGLARIAAVLAVLVFVQVVLGALVAGNDAGRSFPTWPLMAGEFLPSESFDLEPWWRNLTGNVALVQFNHRMMGYAVALVAVFAWWRARRSALAEVRQRLGWVVGAVAVQVVLGIVTVLQAAPLLLSALHQLGAVAVFVLVLQARFACLYPKRQGLRG